MTTLREPAPTVHERLEHTWRDAPGLVGWLTTVDHKRIGNRYIVTAMIFFLLSGVQALIMRLQLAVPDNTLVDPQTFNELYTMHGTTMIFLFNTPIVAGFGNYILPLQIGTRDMAFPRLNAFSYWVYLFAGIFIYSGYLVDQLPTAGWFAYPPFTGSQFSPDMGMDFWAIGVAFLGVSTTVGGINFIVTTFKLRAPGMSVSRLPLFVWAFLATSFMIVFALPGVTLAAVLLEFDRAFGTHFYNPGGGGLPVLYQHLFWFWGHPEVYILFVPATGVISMIIPVFARRPIVGYLAVAASLVAIAFISFGVWVHHMFATGVPVLVGSFFSAAGLLITIPSGVQIFAWLATLWQGRVRWKSPMLFSVGFLTVFVLGGITGVMVSVIAFDWQATDTYFIVAHFHYVLNGGVVFPMFAALHYWFPKFTGRMFNEPLAQASFWLMFIGFNVAFFPQHILGLWGMPRRVYTYQSELGWDGMNMLSTIGGFVFALGVLVVIANFAWAWKRGAAAGPNPWEADSLEWATTSPPRDYNFLEIPVVGSRNPLWNEDHREGIVTEPEHGGEVLAPAEMEEETLGTAGLDARREAVLPMPEPTYWPIVLAFALTVICVGVLLTNVQLIALGFLGAVGAAIGWFQPHEHGPEPEPEPEQEREQEMA
ncbi:MAG TPA: cytochrome c oxidase subunit I [Egibacteraceae bacterium]|nr:cytochrome c oxidase subunit I [Actinomycetota bacterium]HWB72721.1 cytochrome c oxidase subunit I [Egibacteraceae bacterium]